MSKEAGISISAETLLSPAFTKFNLSLGRGLLTQLIVDYGHTH